MTDPILPAGEPTPSVAESQVVVATPTPVPSPSPVPVTAPKPVAPPKPLTAAPAVVADSVVSDLFAQLKASYDWNMAASGAPLSSFISGLCDLADSTTDYAAFEKRWRQVVDEFGKADQKYLSTPYVYRGVAHIPNTQFAKRAERLLNLLSVSVGQRPSMVSRQVDLADTLGVLRATMRHPFATMLQKYYAA